MSFSRNFLHGWIAATVVFLVVGCNSTTPTTDAEPGETGHTHEHADGGHDHAHDTQDIADNLAQLSPEDRALAEKQKVCLVGGEPLGAMGVPVKMEIEGKTVFLCCEGCEEAILADPQKYLAKLPAE